MKKQTKNKDGKTNQGCPFMCKKDCDTCIMKTFLIFKQHEIRNQSRTIGADNRKAG